LLNGYPLRREHTKALPANEKMIQQIGSNPVNQPRNPSFVWSFKHEVTSTCYSLG
jgi:hypothetical protein